MQRSIELMYMRHRLLFLFFSVLCLHFMLILTLIQYLPITAEQVTEILMDIFPRDVSKYIKIIIDEIFVPSKALLSGSAIAAVWAAGKGIMGLTNGLNSCQQSERNPKLFYDKNSICFLYDSYADRICCHGWYFNFRK